MMIDTRIRFEAIDLASGPLTSLALASINAMLRTMTLEDQLNVRTESDAGNIAAVADIFRRNGLTDPENLAASFVAARLAAAARPSWVPLAAVE